MTTPSPKRTLIFIHGFYGSALREQGGGRTIFLTLREILFGRSALSLHQAELGTPAGPTLEVAGLLESVSILPAIYNVDIYANLIAHLNASARGGVQVVSLAYDWRRPLDEAVKALGDLIERSPGHEISLAAHSMGGLVAAKYLAERGAKARLHRVAFFGVPFGGTFGIFRNMQRGAPFRWNRHLLPAEAVASFSSSYHLLPIRSAYLVNRDGSHAPVELGVLNFWETNRLGLLHDEGHPKFAARKDFTRKELARARAFLADLDRPHRVPENLRILNVIGFGRPTVNSGFRDLGGEFVFDTDSPERNGWKPEALLAEGDGTVTLESAALPAFLTRADTRVARTAAAHDRLFHDPEIQKLLQEFFGF